MKHVVALFSILALNLAPLHAQSKSAKNSLDAFIDWSDPLSLTLSEYKKIAAGMTKKASGSVYRTRTSSTGYVSYAIGGHMGASEDRDKVFNLFGGEIKIDGLHMAFEGEKPIAISFGLGEGASANDRHPSAADLARVKDKFAALTGDSSPRPYEEKNARGRPPLTGQEWRHSKFWVQMYGVPTNSKDGTFSLSGAFSVSIVPPGGVDQRPMVTTTPAAPVTGAQAVNLDALLNFSSLWTWAADDLERNYIAKVADPKAQSSPAQFEWLSSMRDRARFARTLFPGGEMKLTMFAGSLKVEEAVVEFINGRAARATVSFYNRGDSGDIDVKDFDRLFKTVGQNLGQVLKAAPKRQLNSTNAALPVVGWMWTAPAAVALLEYTEYNTPGKVTRPEFLRLKLAAPGQTDFSMGKMGLGVQGMELTKRVTRSAGDVYVSGLPMVDQGQKGYCVAASCQRLFEYLHIPCDQHELATLVSVDAESGVDILAMQKSLGKIDSKFGVSFKTVTNPQADKFEGKQRDSQAEFISAIKQNCEKGIPLLWALNLGRAAEYPPLPGGGQIRGGHMRIIIGYNMEKNEVLFTDSWGAGHELKRMGLADAYAVTLGLYSMAPRGL